MKRYLNILVLSIFATSVLSAENPSAQGIEMDDLLNLNYKPRIEKYMIYGGFGLSTMLYETNVGKRQNGLGGHFGVGYSVGLSKKAPNLRFVTGIEAALYNTTYTATTLKTSSMATDFAGDEFEFRNTLNEYKEKKRAIFLQIPLMLKYRFDYNPKQGYYIMGGGKVAFPISGKYTNSATSIKNAGYYAHSNSLFDSQRFMGFGLFDNLKAEGDLKFKPSFLLSLEAGTKLNLYFLNLDIGVFMDYGLISVRPDSEKLFVQYRTTSTGGDFSVNSMLSENAQLIDKMKPFAVGIKLRLGF